MPKEKIEIGFLSARGISAKESFIQRSKSARSIGIILLNIPISEENISKIKRGRKIKMTYLTKNGVEKEKIGHIPHVCYDRTALRIEDSYRRMVDHMIEVMEQRDVDFINSRAFRKLIVDKWQIYEILDDAGINTPETSLFSRKNLENMLSKHSKVFIKLREGCQGIGQLTISFNRFIKIKCTRIRIPINSVPFLYYVLGENKKIEVTRVGKLYTVRFHEKEKSRNISHINILLKKKKGYAEIQDCEIFIRNKNPLERFRTLYRILNRSFLIDEKYVIQEAIDVDKSKDRVYDLRQVAQKNRNGNWEMLCSYVRIASEPGKEQANVSLGGEVIDPQIFFEDYVEFEKEALTKSSFSIIRVLEKRGLKFGEIAFDYLIDKNMNCVSIEINSKPGLKGITYLSENSSGERSLFWKRSIRSFLSNPFKYALHLHP